MTAAGASVCVSTHMPIRIWYVNGILPAAHRSGDTETSARSNPIISLPTFFHSGRKISWSLKVCRDTSVTYREKVEGERREAEVIWERGKERSQIPSIAHMTC